MAVSDGQRANAQTFNDAFLSRTQDSDTVGIVGLNHPTSGGLISNAQQFINTLRTDVDSNDIDITNLQLNKEDKANKGVANGYAELDSGGKVPLAQIPDKFASIEGNWDASTNTPTLADGVGNLGEIYVVNVAGTQDLGSGSQTFDVGDWVVYNSSNIWLKTINSTAVTSVNTQTGAVSLALDNLTDVDITTTPPVNGQALVYDGANWVPGAGGGGEGRINYVQNSDAEIDTSLWLTYDDGAVSVPVDGNGGIPSAVTISQITTITDRLRGNASFSFAKSAIDGQGEGFAHDCALVDNADLGDRLQVSFDYKMIGVTPSNYIDGDVKIYLYDSDNSVLVGAIENDDGGDLLFSENPAVFTGWINTKTTADNYRLIFHITSTNALAWEIAVDNIFFGPVQSFTPVTPLTDWEAFTPTGTHTTNTTYSGFKRRVGSNLEVVMNVNYSGTPDNVFLEVDLPTGLTIDGTKLPGGIGAVNYSVGLANINDSGSGSFNGRLFPLTSTTIRVLNLRDFTSTQYYTGFNGNGIPFTAVNGDSVYISYTVPIQGWNATNVISNTELTQKTMKMKANTASAISQGTSPLSAIIFGTIDFDEFNSYNNATGIFTAPKTGYYHAKSQLSVPSNVSNANQDIYLYKNSSTIVAQSECFISSASGGDSVEIDVTIYLSKGETLEVRSANSQSTSSNIGAHKNYFEVRSLPDFTSYGVLNPQTEYLEIETVASLYGSSGYTAGSWIVPTTVFKLTLTPGTWDLEFLSPIQGFSAAGQFYSEFALSTSTTPGSGIIAQTLASTHDTASTHRYTYVYVKKSNFTISSNTDIYVQFRLTNASGFTNGSLYYGSTGTSEAKIFARRVK